MFEYLQSLSLVLPEWLVLGTFVPDNRNAGGSTTLFRRQITTLLRNMERVVTHWSRNQLVHFFGLSVLAVDVCHGSCRTRFALRCCFGAPQA